MSRAIVVAEPGCTHEGSVETLLALVDLAAATGCDAFKAQWMSRPEEVVRRRNAGDYLPYYQWLRFPLDYLGAAAQRARKLGLKFGCTVYLPEDVAAVDPFVDFYKVAAFEAESSDLLGAYAKAMAENEKILIVSLGLGANKNATYAALDEHHVDGDRARFLLCVSAYPTPPEQLNFASLHDRALDGVSDHTRASAPESKMVGALAVAAGARIIERHIRLESCRPTNPDYLVSMTLHELADYVQAVRVAETVAGTGSSTPKVQEAEQPMLKHKAVDEKKEPKREKERKKDEA